MSFIDPETGRPRGWDGRAEASDVPRLPSVTEDAFIEWEPFFVKDRADAEWLFDDVLARGRGHAIYAKHGTGKSLFSLWVCVEMARAGHVVVYVDYEQSEDDLYERLMDMGADSPPELERLSYLLLPSLPPLNSAEGAADLLALIDSVQARWPDAHLVVVIDTISRAVEGEENSNDTIRGFYRHTGLGLKQRGVTWVRLAHAGKDTSRGQRGGSAAGDDVDVVWKLLPTEDGLELRAEKRRMGWVPEKTTFRKITDPELRFERVSGSWPAGTMECAEDLDNLGVDLEAGWRAAQQELQAASKGRRAEAIRAAVKWRRELAQRAGTHPGTAPPAGSGGPTPGPAREEPLAHGPDPLPDPLGPAPTGQSGPIGSPPRGTQGPSPSPDEGEVVERLHREEGLEISIERPPSSAKSPVEGSGGNMVERLLAQYADEDARATESSATGAD